MMKIKKKRQRLNEIELEKKITDDFRKRANYLFPGKDKVTFLPPAENPMNRSLSNHKPSMSFGEDGKYSPDGNYELVKIFYIPETENKAVDQLLEKYNIPVDARENLKWCFLNMVFAQCEADYSTKSSVDFERHQEELQETFDWLEELKAEKILLRGLRLDFREKTNPTAVRPVDQYGPMKSKMLKGHVAVQFIEKVLQEYQEIKQYELFSESLDIRKNHGKTDPFFGHKNARKHAQHYYASVIFDYLRKEIVKNVFDHIKDSEEIPAEISRLSAQYPRKLLYVFIGRLMLLSGLLEQKEEYGIDDTLLIQTMEKKLVPKSRGEKRQQQFITENNQNPEAEAIYFQPLHEML